MGDRLPYFAADFNAGRSASRRALAIWQKDAGSTPPPPSFAAANRGKLPAGARRPALAHLFPPLLGVDPAQPELAARQPLERGGIPRPCRSS